MFEHHFQPLLPRKEFYRRMLRGVLNASVIVGTALAIGMVGYHGFETMGWIDAFVNAAMILSGMGPVTELHTNGGKIFAGCYALFSGLAFITSLGIIFAPAIHRSLHDFHMEEAEVQRRAREL
jgi:hypothetical protein